MAAAFEPAAAASASGSLPASGCSGDRRGAYAVEGDAYQCENHHDEVLSPNECNKLMYSLNLGDGRKIKLVYSVPRGQCINLF